MKMFSQTQFSKDMFHFYENYKSIGLRIRRMETEYAWAEDPASRARRFVTNVRVSELDDNRLGCEELFISYTQPA